MRTANFRLVILATLVVVMLAGCSSGSESEPSATVALVDPTKAATAEPENQSQTVEDLLFAIESRIELIRGIKSPGPVEHKFVDQAGMQDRLAEEFADPEIVEQLVKESALLKLLGVIPQDSNLTAIYESMFGSQVLGLYDPEKEQFFVLGDDASGADSIDTEAQLTYAHEYVHRLQDAKFDLEALEDLATNDDMSFAISALIEGDATTAQTQYMLSNYDLTELAVVLESALASQAELPESPPFLQKSLEFPYREGAGFVGVLNQMGRFAAVDAVFNDLPKSTEQILHPEKYFDKEEPKLFDIPDDAMGAGWSVQAENVLGEFFLKTWLETLGSEDATAAAAGWGGDAYVVFENDIGGFATGDFALGVGILWDTNEDAREFFVALSGAMAASELHSKEGDGIPGVLEGWNTPGGHLVMSRWSTEGKNEFVVVAIAPSSGGAQMLQMRIPDEHVDNNQSEVIIIE